MYMKNRVFFKCVPLGARNAREYQFVLV